MSCKNITISPAILMEIESALNSQLFRGCQIGITINDTLINAFDTSNRNWDINTRFKDFIRYYYHRYFQPAYSERKFDELRGKILFTWLFDRQDLKEFVLPLVEKYGAANTVVVAPELSMQAQLPQDVDFVVWKEFPKIDMAAWRTEFIHCEKAWRISLNKIVRKNSLPNVIVDFIIDRLQVQSQRLMAAAAFLDLACPTVIVTEYDRNEHSSCLLIAARQRGIPSVTMIHSALNPEHAYGFVPILADQVCCWGQRHVSILTKARAEQSRLVVTGCHSLSRALRVGALEAKAKIEIPFETPTILLATSPIKTQDKMKYAQEFCVAMSKMPTVVAIVRLHPAEQIEEYKDLIIRFPSVRFFENNAMTRDESLAASDIVVIHDSCFGSDALMKGKLLVILDVLNTPLGMGQELADLAGCPIAKTASDLESICHRVLFDINFRGELHDQAEKYASLYSDSYGLVAAEKVYQVINEARSRA
jgi:hypothetical protein